MSDFYHKIVIQDRSVTTMVIYSESELSIGLMELLSNIDSGCKLKRVVGLDIERSYCDVHGRSSDKVVLLKLCAGCFCLLIRLCQMSKEPLNALANFLGLPDLLFVGVGIKFCLVLLERDYGLRCRNYVDLRQLAATVRNANHFAYFALADLAHAVCDVTINVKALDVVCSEWGAKNLNHYQVESATTDAFVSFLVGYYLLGGSDPRKLAL